MNTPIVSRILRIVEFNRTRTQDYGLTEICLQVVCKGEVTRRSSVRRWQDWRNDLATYLQLHPDIVDQVRKRLEVDHDGYVDIPIDIFMNLDQLELESIRIDGAD
jgi:hypothetical protein